MYCECGTKKTTIQFMQDKKLKTFTFCFECDTIRLDEDMDIICSEHDLDGAYIIDYNNWTISEKYTDRYEALFSYKNNINNIKNNDLYEQRSEKRTRIRI